MNGHRSTDDRIGSWLPMGAYASKECLMPAMTELVIELPPLPAGVWIPDTVEEMFHEEKVVVYIVEKRPPEIRVLGCGRGTIRGTIVRARVPINAAGTAEYWRIFFPEHLRCEGTFDDGPWCVEDGDYVNLTVRFRERRSG